MNDSMFKVIIADDEEPARKMLITAADWQALNMEIIAEAVGMWKSLRTITIIWCF